MKETRTEKKASETEKLKIYFWAQRETPRNKSVFAFHHFHVTSFHVHFLLVYGILWKLCGIAVWFKSLI